jgi:hypothetical protein
MRQLVSASFFFALACSSSHGLEDAATDGRCALRAPFFCVNEPEPHVCGGDRTTAACREAEWVCPTGTLPNTSEECWCLESERPSERYECTREGWTPEREGACPADFEGAIGDACATEGRECTYACAECSVCNALSCSGGAWTRVALPPCPTFECGPDLRCSRELQYCVITHSDTGEPDAFGCAAYLDECRRCDCLPGDACTGDAEGGITVEYFGG